MNKFAKSIEIAHALFDSKRDYGQRCNHFSFVYYKSRLISIARNSIKTHPINLYNPRYGLSGADITYTKGSCSELNAFIKIRNLTNIPFNKLTLINIRIDNNGRLALSRPCSSCFSLLRYLNPKEIFYSNFFGEFERLDVAI